MCVCVYDDVNAAIVMTQGAQLAPSSGAEPDMYDRKASRFWVFSLFSCMSSPCAGGDGGSGVDSERRRMCHCSCTEN